MTKSQFTGLSQMKDFLSYLTTVSGDLSNITAPPFVLSPKSVTEIPASWAARHDLFLGPAHEDDAARRALLVLKNSLCSLKSQVYDTTGSDAGPKKPLNAFLGELFIGEFAGADGDGDGESSTRLISEQVSHHPPVTACVLYNRKLGISSTGYVAQETTFSPTSGVRVQQIGHAIIRDETHRESHLRTLPTITIKGLFTGYPYPELEGTCYISSSSGYLSTIEFGGKKTWLGAGPKNSVRAELTNVREGGKKVFEVTGQWNGRLTVRDGVDGSVIEEFDVDDVPLSKVKVQPVEKQSPWESRRAWAKVMEGIRKGNMNMVISEKNKIEEAQRQMRQVEKRLGSQWPTMFFRKETDSREFALLAKAIPDHKVRELWQNRTAGVWKFVGIEPAEASISEGVYHRNLEPIGQIISG
ncbi:Oxysterol-binding protein [Xylariaceae sp. AK1471]|nr:Oxysterol-binding protein [Xylariaceae sp. AK1471]